MVARLDYAPFGRELSPGATKPDRKFAQLFRDGQTGLDYAQARWYQIRTGRFQAPDPVFGDPFEPGTWNRYAYALNNPLVFLDPTGLRPAECREVVTELVTDSGYDVSVKKVCTGGGGGYPELFSPPQRIDPYFIAAPRDDSGVPGGGRFGLAVATAVGVGVVIAVADGPLLFGDATAVTIVGRSLTVGASAGPAAAAIGATGKVGEQALRQLGGRSHAFFNTSQGTRFIDQLVNGIAYESKVGSTSLSSRIMLQVTKDAELLTTRQVQAVEWHFFRSPVTGAIGPSGPLRLSLEQNNIRVVIR